MTESRQFLRPETALRLSRLDLVARLVVEGFIAGLHKSPYHGFSVEFSEYRPYRPGDPRRSVDWKVLARTERHYVKRFEEETNLKAYLLLDASASMGWSSTGGMSKFRYASTLAASLAYLLISQRDAAGLATFSETLRAFLPPRSIRSHLSAIWGEIERTSPSGRTSLSGTFHGLAERIKRRGLVIVLSDLWDEPAEVMEALKHFRHRKHEVIVFHILDPAERELNFNRDTVFRDLETGSKILTRPWDIRQTYQDSVGELVARYQRECREHNIDYILMDTSQPFDQALFRYLARRQKIGG